MEIKLTILGTGTFFVNKERTSSSYLLEIDKKKILIDCGAGTLVRLSQVGIDPKDIDYVFITHFHPDHTSDLFALFMNSCLSDFYSGGKLTKFPEIIGPKGIYKFMLKWSKNAELPVFNSWNKIKFVDVVKKMKIGDTIVESFKVHHIAFGLSAHSYAYRFTVGKKVIVFSGDATKSLGIENACQNADVFVCDASYSKGKGTPSHMDTYDIGNICQENNVKKVILTHFYPQTNDIDLVGEVKEKFNGQVIRGKDLMKITF